MYIFLIYLKHFKQGALTQPVNRQQWVQNRGQVIDESIL